MTWMLDDVEHRLLRYVEDDGHARIEGRSVMSPTDDERVESGAPARVRRVARTVVRIPIDYCVSLAVLLAPALATGLAIRVLGPDAAPARVAELGYGWPALEGGRWWTPITGAFVDRSLTITFVPGYTFVAVVLLEHRARHWRTLVALVGGQVGGVLLGLLLTAPWRGSGTAFAIQQTTTVDFGISVGGFACLGAWTCYLSARWRRPLQLGVGAYLLLQLLVSGLIFDVSHPLGFVLGSTVGRVLMRPATVDRSPVASTADRWWAVAAVVLGVAVGAVAGWFGGGVGGLFGWGPGA